MYSHLSLTIGKFTLILKLTARNTDNKNARVDRPLKPAHFRRVARHAIRA